MQQRKPRKGQVKRCAGDLVGALHICFNEAVSTCPCCLEPFDGFTSGFGVAVDSGYFA